MIQSISSYTLNAIVEATFDTRDFADVALMLTTELFSVFMKFLFVGISSGSAYIVSRQKLNRPFLALFLLLLGGIFALDATYVFYPEPLIAAAFYMSWCLELALIVKGVAFPAEQFLAKGKGLAEKYPGLAFTPPSVFVVCALIMGFSAFIFGLHHDAPRRQ